MGQKLTRIPWKSADDAYIRQTYENTRTDDIAAHLGRTLKTVYNRARVLGLKKSAEFLSDPKSGRWLTKGTSNGAQFRFPKGHKPHNKGVRRPGYSPGRMAETQFRKGGRSGMAAKNYNPVGTINADTEGFLRIKVRDAVHGKEATGFGNTKVWPLLNRHVWEQANGPIPPKHIVGFKDGNRQNCALENLYLMSMADNARRNSMLGRYPKELIQVIHLKGQLKRRVREKSGNS